MPFTPFHLGPGAVFKAIGGRNFSFMVFGGSQVMMDVEPLVGLLQSKPVLHGYTHTLAGAILIGIAAALIGKPVSAFTLRLLSMPHYPLTWLAAFSGAFAGTLSHIALDALMHSDINPWWPVAQGNGLLHIISSGSLHLMCVGLGIVGGTVIALRAKRDGKA